MDTPDMHISAVAVHHGDVPSLGYLINMRGKTIVFAGDQSFLSEDFAEAFRAFKPDILVMHNVTPEGEG